MNSFKKQDPVINIKPQKGELVPLFRIIKKEPAPTFHFKKGNWFPFFRETEYVAIIFFQPAIIQICCYRACGGEGQVHCFGTYPYVTCSSSHTAYNIQHDLRQSAHEFCCSIKFHLAVEKMTQVIILGFLLVLLNKKDWFPL